VATEKFEFWRIYSTADGSSSMERVHLTLDEYTTGWISKRLSGDGAVLRRAPPDRQVKWHTAPRRQLGITIQGEGEIETGDGQRLVVKPGVVTLLEDLTGKGHLTRGRGTEDRLVVFVAVNDDVKFV